MGVHERETWLTTHLAVLLELALVDAEEASLPDEVVRCEVVGRRRQLAERERLRRDGAPQRRVVVCIAKSNPFAACQRCKHFEDLARNQEIERAPSPPPSGRFASLGGAAGLAPGADDASAGAYTGLGGVMLDAGSGWEWPDGSACSFFFFPKHGKQLILPFPRRFPVAATLYTPERDNYEL
jgi:hypothetical protein